MKKGGYQSNPVGERVEYPIKPFPVMIQKTRRQVEDFLGHCSQAQSSPSENYGAPRNHGTFLGQAIAQRNLLDKNGEK